MAELPLPVPSPDAQPFWEYLHRGELRIQRCAGCNRLRHPPQPQCPECGSFKADWFLVCGHGTVYSFIVTRQPVHPALVDRVPFATVSVTLDEGPRLISRLTDVDPDEITIGLAVELVLVPMTDEITLPLFRRAR